MGETPPSGLDYDRLLHIVETAPVMLAEVNKNLIYTFVNSSYAALFGKTQKEVINQKVKDVLGEKGFESGRHYMNRALSGETVHYDIDLSELFGETRVLKVSYSPQYDDSKNVTGFIAAIIDKTDEFLATQRADEMAVQLEAAHHLSLSGFTVLKSIRDDKNTIIDFEFIYSNPKAEELSYRKPGEFLGKRFLDIFPANKENGLFDAYVDVVNNGTAFVEELQYTLNDVDDWIELSVIKLGDGCAVSFKKITERKQAEQRTTLLMNELNHRVKNTLATVQSMASQTAFTVDDISDFSRKFEPRLRSIAGAHDILLASKTGHASLKSIIDGQLRPYVAIDSNRLKLDGKNIMLDDQASSALGLVLHELVTNACKYGALSNEKGYISVRWKKVPGYVKINWEETDGPYVSSPTKKGFGSTLIEQSLKYSLNGDVSLKYNPTGLEVEIYLPIKKRK